MRVEFLTACLAVAGCEARLPDDDRRPLRDGMRVRLLGPLAGARAGARRPVVRWEVQGPARPVVLEFCADRACARVAQSVRAEGGAGAPAEPLPYGAVYWRVRDPSRAGDGAESATWWLRVPRGAREAGGIAWRPRSATDVDGDGVDDAVGPDGVVRTGPLRGARLASGGAPPLDAGDLDGDGYPELMAARPGAAGAAGEVTVYRTPLRPGLNEPAWTLRGEAEGLALGDGVAAGDFDGDGYGDLAAGVPRWGSSRGQVRVYRGGAAGLRAAAPWATVDSPLGLGYGFRALAAGDLAGRGADALLAGAPGTLDAERTAAAAYVFEAAVALPVWRVTRAGMPFGTWGLLADVTGDGRTDAVVAATDDRADSGGCLRVFPGAPLADVDRAAVCARQLGVGEGTRDLGRYLDAGDLDGDGALDLVAAPDQSGSGPRHVYIQYGGARLLREEPPEVRASPVTDVDSFGRVAVGDYDDDGYADVASFGTRGAATLGWRYRGGPEGLARTPDGEL